MTDAAMGAFSVFFTQSPSFLDAQRNLEVTQGCSNARSLFAMTQTPSDNHIPDLLDPVPPATVFAVFSYAVDALQELGHLESYRSINGDLLVALDGTEYFSSSKIHCDQCSVTEHKNGSITYSHTVVTPVTGSLCAQAAYVSKYEDQSTGCGSERMSRINTAGKAGHFL